MPQQTDTPCKNCIFAEYNDITQIGCKLGMIEKFRNKGTPILEVYDNDKEFYVIQGRRCMSARTKHWFYKDYTVTEQRAMINREVAIPYNAIIFAEHKSYNDIKKTIESLAAQTIKPWKITVVLLNNHPDTQRILKVLDNTTLSWKIQGMMLPNTPKQQVLNTIVGHVPITWYAVFHAGCVVPKDTFDTINKFIHEELNVVTVIRPNSQGDCSVVLREVHKNYFYAELITTLQDSTVYRIHDICPDFPQ